MSFRNTVFRILAVVALTVAFQAESVDAQTFDSTEGETFLMVDTLPDLPFGITSFGGALCDGHVYIFGGNRGGAHTYYKSGQNDALYRLNVEHPQQWERVDQSRGLQGLAMVSHKNKLYRLGGFEARNEKGEDQDLHSIGNFDMFDPASGTWTELPAMPEARSSFDAAVVDDTLFVVGGWTIAGGEETVWLKTAWSFDLSRPDGEWTAMPNPPFVRRAMSVSYQGENLYVIGGMQETGGPTRAVGVYNMKSGQWSEGPELPGEEGMEGFGNSSFNVGGQLCISTIGGHIYKLDQAGASWEKIGSLETGRFFHRLLPLSENRFALIGGGDMISGKNVKVPVIDLKK